MEAWDRTQFATSSEDLEVEEAIRAVERVIDHGAVGNATRVSLKMALESLRADRGRASSAVALGPRRS